MERQIEQGEWYKVDTADGIFFLPADLGRLGMSVGESRDEDHADWGDTVDTLADYIDVADPARIQSITIVSGWGARLSAPGYMDCTEWCVFNTEQEAIDYLDEMFGPDDDDDTDESDD